AGAVRDGPMARDHAVEVEREDPIERGGPLPDARACLEGDVRPVPVEEEVAGREHAVFDEQHDEVAVGVPATEVERADCLAPDAEVEAALEDLVRQEVAGGGLRPEK